ncbi:MAG: hypothetical protein LUP96_05210, partial [Methylococcaceae bacterium]|nr:hypothetical protein [Methylococcaceae bacterium]
FLCFYSTASFSLSIPSKQAILGGGAAGAVGAPAQSVTDAIARMAADALGEGAQKQAAEDQAEADRLRKISDDAAAAPSGLCIHFTNCEGNGGWMIEGTGTTCWGGTPCDPNAPTSADTAKAAADEAQATADSHKSAADTLSHIADVVIGRSTGAGSVATGNKAVPVNLLKGGSASGNKDYVGSDGAPNPNSNNSPGRPSSSPCLPGDPRLECSVPNYSKPIIPTDSTGTGGTGSTDPSSCTSCCDASSPAYGGAAKQIDGLRAEQAKDLEKSQASLAKISKFFNNKRVGFDNGIIDGDYQSKKSLCKDTWCGYSFCDTNQTSTFCVQYQEQNGRFKKVEDYGTISNSAVTCPAFTLDFGMLGVQSVDAHCTILESIRPKLALLMTFLTLFIAFRIVSSA